MLTNPGYFLKKKNKSWLSSLDRLPKKISLKYGNPKSLLLSKKYQLLGFLLRPHSSSHTLMRLGKRAGVSTLSGNNSAEVGSSKAMRAHRGKEGQGGAATGMAWDLYRWRTGTQRDQRRLLGGDGDSRIPERW
jgi:hypothetical protein